MLTRTPDIELDNHADEELQLAIGESINVDPDTILQPVKEDNDTMMMDEEGRPQFKPSRDIVRALLSVKSGMPVLITYRRIPLHELKRAKSPSLLTA